MFFRYLYSSFSFEAMKCTALRMMYRYVLLKNKLLLLSLSYEVSVIIEVHLSALPSFKQCDIHNGRIVIDELEQEHLQRERVLIFRVRSWPLCEHRRVISNLGHNTAL